MQNGSISLSALRLFGDVSRAGSFAAAARERGIDPSIVSRHIAALEDVLGFRLFDRNTRRLKLTEAGQIYLDRSQMLLDDLEAAQQEATDAVASPRGHLRVTASVAFGDRWLAPKVAGFSAIYPKISIELLLTDTVVDIVAEGVDVALRLAPQPQGALVATKLMDTTYRVVASPSYLESAEPIMKPDDLVQHSCLRLTLPGYRSLWRFRSKQTIKEVSVNGRIAMSNPLAIRRAALGGAGPALLADWTIHDDIRNGRLIDCLPNWEASAASFDTAAWLLYPTRDYVPAKTRRFIDFLRGHEITE